MELSVNIRRDKKIVCRLPEALAKPSLELLGHWRITDLHVQAWFSSTRILLAIFRSTTLDGGFLPPSGVKFASGTLHHLSSMASLPFFHVGCKHGRYKKHPSPSGKQGHSRSHALVPVEGLRAVDACTAPPRVSGSL